MTFDQRRLVLNSFITSHCFYCPILWMFHSSKLSERIDHIHERALGIVYKYFNLSFQELLAEDNSLNIHYRNLQICKTEIFKVKELMNDILEFIEKPYSLRTTSHFRSRKIRTIKYDIETPSYLGPKLLVLVPNEYKTNESMSLQVMQNSYSPSMFSLSSLNDNSRILLKSEYIYIYIYIYIIWVFLFWLT